MPKLANIMEEIENMLSVPDEELTEEQQAIMAEYLDELAQQEADKIDGFVAFVRNALARANFQREEARRLNASAKAIENKIDRFKDYYRGVMQAHGVKKIQGKVYSASIRSTACVSVDNEALIPDEWWNVKTTREPAKAEILRALKRGEVIPGCSVGQSYSLIAR